MVRVRCPHCGYEWDYKGRRLWITCPNCGRKFRRDRVPPPKRDVDAFVAEGDVIDVVKECVEEMGGRYEEGEAGIDIEMPHGGWERLIECLKGKGVELRF